MEEVSGKENKNVNHKSKNEQNYFLLIESSIEKFMELMPEDYKHYDTIKGILTKMPSNIIYAAPELRLHKLYSIFHNLYTYLPETTVEWAEIGWTDMLDTYNKTVQIISERN
jgi:hypothetical protein